MFRNASEIVNTTLVYKYVENNNLKCNSCPTASQVVSSMQQKQNRELNFLLVLSLKTLELGNQLLRSDGSSWSVKLC